MTELMQTPRWQWRSNRRPFPYLVDSRLPHVLRTFRREVHACVSPEVPNKNWFPRTIFQSNDPFIQLLWLQPQTLNNEPWTTEPTFLLFVLFGLIWCCLVLFGPKFIFGFLRFSQPPALRVQPPPRLRFHITNRYKANTNLSQAITSHYKPLQAYTRRYKVIQTNTLERGQFVRPYRPCHSPRPNLPTPSPPEPRRLSLTMPPLQTAD